MAESERPAGSAAFAEARQLIVRPEFGKAVGAAIFFVVAASVAVALGGIRATHSALNDAGLPVTVAYPSHRIGSLIAIIACGLTGLIAVRLCANEIARLARHRGSPAAASALRLAVQIIGYLVVVITVLALLAVKIESVLLSGAIGSVVLGLAAQQALGNAFAGVVLLVSRPFIVGDYITLRAGAIGGQYDGQVTAITLMFTMMNTQEGPMSLPNAAVLAGATGRRSAPEIDAADGPVTG
ncbi:MAG TPA: mechanosensitive ion channel family protein [Acidothermaceae bacterium]